MRVIETLKTTAWSWRNTVCLYYTEVTEQNRVYWEMVTLILIPSWKDLEKDPMILSKKRENIMKKSFFMKDSYNGNKERIFYKKNNEAIDWKRVAPFKGRQNLKASTKVRLQKSCKWNRSNSFAFSRRNNRP